MAKEQKFAERTDLRELAMEILKDQAKDREICLQVQALMNGTDDTVSAKEVLQELEALRRSGMALTEVFADVNDSRSK